MERRLHRELLYLRPAERLSRSAHVFKELHEGPHIESGRVGLTRRLIEDKLGATGMHS